MIKIAVSIVAVLGAALVLMLALDSCSAPQRLTRGSVAVESVSVASYFEGRKILEQFRTDWYDSAQAFGSLDTARTKPFLASVARFRPLDSLGTFTVAELQFRKTILLHDLNLLNLTADSTQ